MTRSPIEILAETADQEAGDADALAGLRLIANAHAKLRETKGLLRLSEERVVELEQAVAIFEALSASAKKPKTPPMKLIARSQLRRRIWPFLVMPESFYCSASGAPRRSIHFGA